jgi:hypothetical protein
MARKVLKDTIAFEPVGLVPGDDTVVRREVKAGWEVPDNYIIEDESAVEEDADVPRTGLGAAPPYYKNQLDEDGRVLEEHAPEELEGAPRARKARGRRPAAENKA